MFILRFLWAVLTSRWLWLFIGFALLSLAIWIFGPIVQVGQSAPFASEIVRLGMIVGLFILWLIWLIIAQRRAIRANRLFVAEIAAPVEDKPLSAGDQSVAAVGAKFQEIMAELRRRKLGNRKFLRDMPWYVIVGPPATGKTTALRQSGLNFPINLTDDLQGVGGTRNCDWFFSEHAVLIDTAGRYVQQESQPDVDATEWFGFLDLLKKHRGRRALNGVIVDPVRRRAVGGRRGDQGAWPQDPPPAGRAERPAANSPAGLSDADQGGSDQGVRAILRQSVDQRARAGVGRHLRAGRQGRRGHGEPGNLDARHRA